MRDLQRAKELTEEKEKMLSEMEDGGHPILEHMDQVVGKLRQVHTTVRSCGCIIVVHVCASMDVRMDVRA